MQGRGRAGRNGAPGSSELIVNYTKYMDNERIPKETQDDFRKKNYETILSKFCEIVRDEIEKKKM